MASGLMIVDCSANDLTRLIRFTHHRPSDLCESLVPVARLPARRSFRWYTHTQEVPSEVDPGPSWSSGSSCRRDHHFLVLAPGRAQSLTLRLRTH